jgi:hypothetical protein
MSYHQKLQNVIEDQLSLAAIHYLRTHYQEAIDIYKKILLDNRLDYKHMREEGKEEGTGKEWRERGGRRWRGGGGGGGRGREEKDKEE